MTTQPFTVGPLPPGVAAPVTTAQRATYRQALDLEGVFTQHLVDAMMQSATGDEDSQIPGGAEYQEMANQQVNTALINGGGLGLAGALYSQLSRETSDQQATDTASIANGAGGATTGATDPATAAGATDPTTASVTP
jgi:Rod binding domain-containing protein